MPGRATGNRYTRNPGTIRDPARVAAARFVRHIPRASFEAEEDDAIDNHQDGSDLRPSRPCGFGVHDFGV